MSEFAAVLLAGGASRRMGSPKMLIEHEGLPLWRFQMEKLIELKPAELFLSAPLEFEPGPGPWTVLHDRQAGLGPLAGLEAALRVARAAKLIVLAVDMPGVTISFLQSLVVEAGEGGIVPQLDSFFHGTVAVYPRAILPLVEQILVEEDRSFHHLIRRGIDAGLLEIHHVSEDERPFFRNLNRTSDLS